MEVHSYDSYDGFETIRCVRCGNWFEKGRSEWTETQCHLCREEVKTLDRRKMAELPEREETTSFDLDAAEKRVIRRLLRQVATPIDPIGGEDPKISAQLSTLAKNLQKLNTSLDTLLAHLKGLNKAE